MILTYPDGPRAKDVRIAKSLRAKIVGLLFRRSMPDDEALFFPGINAIHTIGMQMPIDVLFLAGDVDGELEIIEAHENVGPRRSLRSRSADHTLELAAGALKRFGELPTHITLREAT
jgi:uncharacterized membrane protein (UPF0127 family)